MWPARVLRKCGKTRETQNLNLEFLFHHIGPPREIIHSNKITQLIIQRPKFLTLLVYVNLESSPFFKSQETTNKQTNKKGKKIVEIEIEMKKTNKLKSMNAIFSATKQQKIQN